MRYITNLAEFQQLIAEETTTLVHFHDPSCNYSSSLVPAFRELSSLYSHVRFATVDTSEASADIEDMFNINSFPTLVVFKNGEKIKKYSGLGSIVKNRPKKNVSEECGDEVLNDYIKLDQIECLNIKTGYEVQNIFENDDTYLVSNDEQLIISIPFEQHVKLKSIQIIPVDIGRAPKKIKLFVNKFSFSFEDVETVEATQEYQFTKEDYEKEAVISLRATKFRCVISVVLFIENNIEDEETTAIKELVLIGSPTGTTSMKDFGDRVKVKDLEWLVETESEYAEDEDDEIEYEGDLHEYLKNHPFMNWMNKMKILRDICNQLYDIYIKNKHLYNKIHSKNIVFKKSGDCVINFEETPDQLESIKYKAPEVLCNKICD
ncbi:galactose-binding domain-like protein, partial [Rhizophagus diaphanus]